MIIEKRIDAFVKLGDDIRKGLIGDSLFEETIIKAKVHNPWFDPRFTRLALESIAGWLTQANLEQWIAGYPTEYFADSDIKVGVIMAGNIPLVGFHDFLSVLISGKVFKGKLSSQDEILLPFLAGRLIAIEPAFKDKIVFVPQLLKDFDAVIATGSNNSARYFDYYFGKYPNIIRHNRNSVAVLTGDETEGQLRKLADDIFMYFGLGCRSVSKIFVPRNYDFPKMLDTLSVYDFLSFHTKYFNNYEYNKSIYLLNKVPHFDNGFSLLTENIAYASPVSVLFYEEYDDLEAVERRLMLESAQIQCVVGGEKLQIEHENFGNAQSPRLNQYADNVDVLDFLGGL